MLDPKSVMEMAEQIRSEGNDGLTRDGIVAAIARTTGEDPVAISEALATAESEEKDASEKEEKAAKKKPS